MINEIRQQDNANQRERGVTLYLAMLLMGTAVTIALFVSQVFAREYRMSVEVANSMKAVYIADSATELTLYQVRIEAGNPPDLGATALNYESAGHYRLFDAPDFSSNDCSLGVFGTTNASSRCSLDAYPAIPLGSVPGCPATSSAPDCTRVETRGSWGGINRAMEIVYENR